ncbi:lysine-rich arabinogalactan protein 19-like [Haliotis rubra]|uniref:lysine-rich arabinogalactan protein 19-like n=1 Tax=Haliotis rubra TaxID=36100 RepID=UPI001EE60695|nr:lysine-rich arabinogalactan protein 19-like [Haliotis rubra]
MAAGGALWPGCLTTIPLIGPWDSSLLSSSYHSGIKQTPFAAFTESDAPTGLNSSKLPDDVIATLKTEEDLQDLINAIIAMTPPSDQPAAPDAPPVTAAVPDPSEEAAMPDPDPPVVADMPDPAPPVVTDMPDPPVVADMPVPDPPAVAAVIDPPAVAAVPDPPSSAELLVAKRRQQISIQRKRAIDSQLQQAEKMVKRSEVVLSEVQVGDNVTVPIPSVDRGRADPCNLIGVITDINDSGMYTTVVKVSCTKYSRNQFDVCATTLYTLEI